MPMGADADYRGRVFYLMGPSGAGKDTLIGATRELAAARAVRVAPRYSTRCAAGNDVYIDPASFEDEEEAGQFLFVWRSHGIAYGIRREVENDLVEGRHVLVSGSRAYLEQARQRCPGPGLLVPVLVRCASEKVLRERLLARGRETAAQIDARLERNRAFCSMVPADAHVIDNSGTVADGARALLALLRGAGCA